MMHKNIKLAFMLTMAFVLLFGITLFELNEVNTANLVFIASETLLFKAAVVPFLLFRIIKKTQRNTVFPLVN